MPITLRRGFPRATIVICCLTCLTLTAVTARAQNDEDGPVVDDSGLGYIDNAILGNQFRVRYDAAYNNVQAARAEFFWPVGGALGPGPGPDTRVDYQDFSIYLEKRVTCDLSLFGELPFRLINPDIQDNTGGLADSNVGFKYRLCGCRDQALTFQFRTYIPSADGSRGLGNGHVSLEPSLLWYGRYSDRLALGAELRDWISVGGSDNVSGNVLRYGIGADLRLNNCCSRAWSAVVEFVGWTVLDGRSAITTPPITTIVDADGDTIVNAKLGLRKSITCGSDVYFGYGRVLTDDTWYDDVVRIEWRTSF